MTSGKIDPIKHGQDIYVNSEECRNLGLYNLSTLGQAIQVITNSILSSYAVKIKKAKTDDDKLKLWRACARDINVLTTANKNFSATLKILNGDVDRRVIEYITETISMTSQQSPEAKIARITQDLNNVAV